MPFSRRIWIYLQSMQPIHITILFSLIHFCSVFFFLGAVAHSVVLPPLSLWYVVASAALFYITFRLNDDIKDEEFDRIYHPQRPMITGIVKYDDLKILSLISFIIMVAINVGRGFVTSTFMVLIVFSAMNAQSFYFPDQVRRSFTLTLITGGHAMLPMMNYYFYTAYCSVSATKLDSYGLIAGVCLLFSLPSAAWEISRKIRAPSDETDFPSYSRRWGLRTATLVPIVYITVTATALVTFGIILAFSMYYVVANVLLGIGVLAIFYVFLLRPTSLHNYLKKANELYDAGARLMIVTEVVWHMS
jgi:UbiA prenyltransferase family